MWVHLAKPSPWRCPNNSISLGLDTRSKKGQVRTEPMELVECGVCCTQLPKGLHGAQVCVQALQSHTRVFIRAPCREARVV